MPRIFRILLGIQKRGDIVQLRQWFGDFFCVLSEVFSGMKFDLFCKSKKNYFRKDFILKLHLLSFLAKTLKLRKL